jgi:hypothetical protein
MTSCGQIVAACQAHLDAGKLLRMPARGGRRSGAGRPVGSGTGRVAISKSISMMSADWKVLDELRGSGARGSFVRALVWQKWHQKQMLLNRPRLEPRISLSRP